MARPLLTAYLLALGGFCYTGALMPVGLLCRLLHTAVLAANSIFSDELHNCDKRLGGAARSKGPWSLILPPTAPSAHLLARDCPLDPRGEASLRGSHSARQARPSTAS